MSNLLPLLSFWVKNAVTYAFVSPCFDLYEMCRSHGSDQLTSRTQHPQLRSACKLLPFLLLLLPSFCFKNMITFSSTSLCFDLYTNLSFRSGDDGTSTGMQRTWPSLAAVIIVVSDPRRVAAAPVRMPEKIWPRACAWPAEC